MLLPCIKTILQFHCCLISCMKIKKCIICVKCPTLLLMLLKTFTRASQLIYAWLFFIKSHMELSSCSMQTHWLSKTSLLALVLALANGFQATMSVCLSCCSRGGDWGVLLMLPSEPKHARPQEPAAINADLHTQHKCCAETALAWKIIRAATDISIMQEDLRGHNNG